MAAVLIGLIGWKRLDRVGHYLVLADKQEGDVLFQSLPTGPLVVAIETITESPWSHCGILLRREGKWVVAEAIGEVRYTPLHLWVARGRGARVEAWRLAAEGGARVEALAAAVAPLVGRPYDFRYAPGDGEVYCSELVRLAYERGQGVVLGSWEKLGDLNWKPQEAFIREMEGGALPLDRPMVTPVSLTRDPRLARVYPR
jgi:uncharacterized protein YycO